MQNSSKKFADDIVSDPLVVGLVQVAQVLPHVMKDITLKVSNCKIEYS